MTLQHHSDFASAADMLAHYNAVRRRLNSGAFKEPRKNPIGSPLADDLLSAATTVADTPHEPSPGQAEEEAAAIFIMTVHLHVAYVLARHKLRHSTVPPRVLALVKWAANEQGFDVSAITGERRQKDLCNARHAAIWLVHTLRRDVSLPALGRAFGDRDHTTILHAIRRIRRELAENSPVGEQARELMAAWQALRGGDSRT